ncbi:M15 family metallopeptidase [Xanthobacter sp. YC-JY1]|uniref:M15 family metallopeptidase n=1 Tax=Xanthobacter sp. YC-JY1 TaxID=2419844 RepID=UPI001F02D3BF|nr:M15 family metallopeptidase [Xanthobacter sp. YC-JY1]
MDLRDLQSALNARGWTPPLALDGEWGPATDKAVSALLAEAGVAADDWPAARREVAAMQALCKLAGIDAGAIDGRGGPQTRHALDVWDARQRGDTSAETWRDPPAVQPMVWPKQVDVQRFYGAPGEHQTMLVLPFPMRLAWETDTIVKRISVHEKVHDSAARVFDRVLDHYGIEGIQKLGVDLFGGSLNVRRMRGGSAWSMHSWGIAIDFDPDRNQLKWGRDRARLAQPDAEVFWQLWEEEGWLSLGRARNYDWMHVQAARL